MKSHRLAATLVVLLLASAPLALAQTGTGKKKGTKEVSEESTTTLVRSHVPTKNRRVRAK